MTRNVVFPAMDGYNERVGENTSRGLCREMMRFDSHCLLSASENTQGRFNHNYMT
jgi:hypothetical protein